MRFSGLFVGCVLVGLIGASCAQRQSEPASFASGASEQPQHQQQGDPSSTGSADAKRTDQYPALNSLDDAERAYARAEQELLALYAPRSIAQPEGGAIGGDEEADKPARPAQANGAAAAPHRCARVCQALSSLERARDAICRLTSATDQRCERANISVEKNRARAAQCDCPRPPAPPEDPDAGAKP